MSRSIVIGNGNVVVAYDSNYAVRDIFFPQVGMENHTAGNLCRTGFYVDGRFAWVSDPGWERTLGYLGDTLVTNVVLRHPGLGLTVHFTDYVEMARDWWIRNLELTVDRPAQVVRVFFHYDWYIKEVDLGCTVFYEPKHRALIAYKADRYFLIGGQAGDQPGISAWAAGKKGQGRAGTWVDAEDGELGGNPIEQGSVDCTVSFDCGPQTPGVAKLATHWLCMGRGFEEVTDFGQDLILSRGEQHYRGRTQTYWDVWSEKDYRKIEEALGHEARHLYRRSVLTMRTQIDNRGGIIAATDFDVAKFSRDTYTYVWPRDGALIANALDRAGHPDLARAFFEFGQRVLHREGFFLHKYTPDGRLGSSWHPWIDGAGSRVLPIQEDETGLVLWALWEHFNVYRDHEFAARLYSSLVVPAADWMASYVDPSTGLPSPSWDLWEERWGVHAFTVGSVWGGLRAAQNFADLFGDEEAGTRFKSAADRLLEASDRHLYCPDLGRFARRLVVAADGSLEGHDPVLDSALVGLWRFGMYAPDDDRIVQTMEAIRDRLSVKSASGGLARYTDDHYFQVDRDLDRVPGNPWFICTLWLAQWYIATAATIDHLQVAKDVIDSMVACQLPGGLLPEQLDPHTRAPLSVSPLTWSHAELVITVDDYVRKLDRLQRRPTRPVAIRSSIVAGPR